MKALSLKTLVIILTAAAFFACAGQTTKEEKIFEAIDLNAMLKSGKYKAKVNSFVAVLDASGSMSERYTDKEKVDLGRDILSRMNQTLPDLAITGALVSFGQTYNPFGREVNELFGPAAYDRKAFDDKLQTVQWAGGLSPLERSVDRSGKSIVEMTGNVALIMVSDFKHMDREAVMNNVSQLNSRMGDRLCIYTLLVGNDPGGRALAADISKGSGGGCGSSISADSISEPAQMADFVTKVFLTAVDDTDGDGVADARDICPGTPQGVAVDAKGCPLDSDGDGVPDYLDQCPGTPAGASVDTRGCALDTDKDGVPDYADRCPGTPAGVAVDARGCPLDSDGDGVPDYLDQCPGTPQGANVNTVGCWVLAGVNFDVGKATIKPGAHAELDGIADIMNRNPDLRFEIQGHTDSTGNAAFNQQLSERRAAAVMDYLVQKGVAPVRLRARGLGLKLPVANNDTTEGRAMNRRVEFQPLH